MRTPQTVHHIAASRMEHFPSGAIDLDIGVHMGAACRKTGNLLGAVSALRLGRRRRRCAGYRRRIMTRKFITCAAAAAMLPLLSNAGFAAAPPCGTRDEIVKKLSEEYKETPQSVGLVNQDAVVEVFVSEKGSWTIIASGTDGNSCILSSGEGWETNVLAALPDA
jgi:hypothetical protein